LGTLSITGDGLTVIVKVESGPEQLLRVGVKVIVAVITADVVLLAVKEGILPEPDAARPIAVFVLVQAILAPVGVELKLTAEVELPLQNCKSFSALTRGVGLIV
jgi:hypothetical protein